MASISSILSPTLLHTHTPKTHLAKPPILFLKPISPKISLLSSFSLLGSARKSLRRTLAVAEEAVVDTVSEAARRLYVGNIPRDVTNDALRSIVEKHGAVDKAEVMYDKYSGRSRRFGFVTMKTIEDAAAAAEKLNGTEVKGRQIKVNVTEKPLSTSDVSFLQTEESQFIDSPHKVYVGNLSKTVTMDKLKDLFAEKGKVLSAKVSRIPGTSKSTGFGFVSFSSEEDVEAVISSLNNALLEGQKIRVNKA